MRCPKTGPYRFVVVARSSNQRLRSAVELVLQDAHHSLGSDALSVFFSDDDVPAELGYLTDPTSLAQSWDVFATTDAFIFVKGESASAGLADIPGATEEELLVHVADAVQEVAVESDAYWGRGFPACPEHPDGAPLWPVLRDGRPVWACLDGGRFAVPIGHLRDGP